MKILGIETSCDETSVALVESSDKKSVTLLSHTLATSMLEHAKTGGIIPEMAARNQIRFIIPVIKETLKKAHTNPSDVDAIAVTYGPGLIGSLLVGVETAKTLSFVWNKPIIPVNHLFGHIFANLVTTSEHKAPTIIFPAIVLVVSGGHTDLLLMKSLSDFIWLGGTRDDAAGEAYDKIGRMLGLSYPAGPEIEKLAKKGNPKAFKFPRPLLYDKAFDFSFSGLKTAALREIQPLKTPKLDDFARGIQDAIIDVLVTKTLAAVKQYNAKSILLGGGVAANQTLRDAFLAKTQILGINFFAPPKTLCTDNGVMIAAAAHFQKKEMPFEEITANPELYFD